MKNGKVKSGKSLSFSDIQGYFLADLNHPMIKVVLEIVFWSCILIIIFWLVYFAIITIMMPYQIEYREGAAQVMTQILLKGENPFSSQNQPLALNNYGVAYNFIVLPLAALFGNTLLVHRIVTFLFIIFSCLLIFQTISIINRDRYFAVAGAVFIFMGLASRGGNGAFPSAMATFLFLGAILIPFNRSFDFSALSLSAILCVIAFYTKPYFVLSFGIVASYVFVFVSKKKGLFYGLLFAILFIFSCLFVRYLYKYYFIDTIISNLSNNASPSFGRVSIQLDEFGREFFPSIILAAAMLLGYLTKLHLTTFSLKEFFSRFDFLNLDQPLVVQPPNYFAYFLACSLLAFVLILGQHRGAYMTYLYQIMLPPFFLLLFQSIKPATRLAFISLFLLLPNMILFGWLRFNPVFLQQKDSSQWAILYQYVDSSKQILNSPVITSEMIRVGMTPVDSGQTEYFYGITPYAKSKLISLSYDTVNGDGLQYKYSIRNLVIKTEYDKIIVTAGYYSFAPRFTSLYYSRVNTLTIPMPQTDQQWTIEIWEPNNKNQNAKP
jgi:hypothetical protein